MTTLQRHALIAFGAFQVDLDSGELRKFGQRIKLQSQPFRALAILLSRPGEVVTREELQLEIWGTNTSVDFERGLASAINKLREALGDSAENPRYIETLAKRGYRFIAPVTVEASPTPPIAAAATAIPQPEFAQAVNLIVPVPPHPIPLIVPVPPHPIPASPRETASVPMLSLRRSTIAALLALVVVSLVVSSWLIFQTLHSSHFVRSPRIRQLTHSNEIFAGLPNSENLPVLATDGPRIYASTLSGGLAQISSMDLSEGRMQPVSIPDELSPVSIADLSSDGSRLLLRGRRSRESEQPLWIVPTSGSSALRVGDVLAHDATWMPGGKDILYAAGDGLGVVQLDTGLASPLVQLPGRAFWPRWSPDGRLLRFTLVDPITHASNLWEFEAATHHLHRLQFPELAGLDLCCGSWTPDAKTYVFEGTSLQETNIWAIGVGPHAAITELTNGPLRYLSPLPAHDNRTIYFIGLEQPAGMRLYDRKSRSLVPAPSDLADAQRVTYSRDGNWVAWTDGESRLWRARGSDGSGRLQLTANDLEVFLAQWSPDGKRLVLMAKKPGETWRLYDVSAEGGVTRLLLADKRNLADPDWSPDGRQLVFGREDDMMGKEDGPRDLEFLDLESQKVRKLPGSENLFSPRWSPDGRWIVALSLDQARILLYDVQLQTWKTLFAGGAADPVWSSDSRSLYFQAFAEPGSPILRVALDGSSEPVVDFTRLGIPAGENYFFSGVTPSGSPLIKPRIGSGNLYSVTLSH